MVTPILSKLPNSPPSKREILFCHPLPLLTFSFSPHTQAIIFGNLIENRKWQGDEMFLKQRGGLYHPKIYKIFKGRGWEYRDIGARVRNKKGTNGQMVTVTRQELKGQQTNKQSIVRAK